MKTSVTAIFIFVFTTIGLATSISIAQEKEIPEALKPWTKWVTWDDEHLNCPTPYNGAKDHLCFWPSQLTLITDQQTGTWKIVVNVFEKTWVPLPGSSEHWPQKVQANGDSVPVVERDGIPCVQLSPGLHRLAGEFRWQEMPQRIAIPKQIGILSLTVDGAAVPTPNWDADGSIWLKRLRAEETDKDLVTAQVYRVIEDGIPLWLRTEIELTVSGKSREEQLGSIIPQGWMVSTVDSPIPVAIDEQGRLMAQVRAGKWTVAIDSFRSTDAKEFQFATDAVPVSKSELIGFKSNPALRVAEIDGLQMVDVSQTTFPEKWRGFPVFQWDTSATFRLVEKMRGMGLQRPEGLHLTRQLWLDEDGSGFIYRDGFSGRMQQVWRLDVGSTQELGAVRIDGEPQLITANPRTQAHGVEIRSRNLNMEAIGRLNRTSELSAIGWKSDADSLNMTLTLPPGWRVFALFGADRVDGDWLTSWTLLDLFILLVFSLAVLRLWGFPAAVVAFIAVGLSYQELGAPQLSWLFLLIPLALLRVVPEGAAKKLITLWKNVAIVALLLILVPFIARQIQSAIYPQLEAAGMTYGKYPFFDLRINGNYMDATRQRAIEEHNFHDAFMRVPPSGVSDLTDTVEAVTAGESEVSGADLQGRLPKGGKSIDRSENMFNKSDVIIQTGPAAPEWDWNQVTCDWSGPVAAEHKIRPIFISLSQNRIITVVRLAFLLLLVAIILGVRKLWKPFARPRVASAVTLLLCVFVPAIASAQIPDKEILETLRQRLLERSDAYPQAAEIAAVTLKLNEGKVSMEAEIHAAIDVAVPLPGRLPDWSPISVKLDDAADAIVCRINGYLWVNIPKGVHKVMVEGMLPDVTEWQWGSLLKPRLVSIEAPGWTFTGVRPNGVPEQQIIFSRAQKLAEGTAAYDQKLFNAVVAVERTLEVGLVWKVHNVATRLSATGKAVSLKIPLLPGENVLSSNAVVAGGMVEVRLAAGETTFLWESELPITEKIELNAAQTEQWVERWLLVTSPVWNVSFEKDKLSPIYEPDEQKLIPTWNPWPGESVSLALSQPKAVSGASVTVRHAQHSTSIGDRLRTTELTLDVESSLGGDFALDLNPDAEITSLKIQNEATPVRRDQSVLIIPVRRGRQTVMIAWQTTEPLKPLVRADRISLPVEAANVISIVNVPENRWILWADGPLRGPAVRFWVILVVAILAALILGSMALSPLRRFEWMLLTIGLTQVHLIAAMFVVGWLFALAWREKQNSDAMPNWRFNLLQLEIIVLTAIALGILVVVVGQGLLGSPEMFIVGNGSTRTSLQWFQPRISQTLPEPYFVSVSVWYFRLLMLLWALWLASSLIRWLRRGWEQFSRGGTWKRRIKTVAIPPAPNGDGN